MPYSDNFFFWPVVVLIGMVVIILSVRFLIRLALFIVAILVIWYCLSYVGLAPPPAEFFKREEPKKLETACCLLNQNQAGRCLSIEKLMKADIPFFRTKRIAKRE